MIHDTMSTLDDILRLFILCYTNARIDWLTDEKIIKHIQKPKSIQLTELTLLYSMKHTSSHYAGGDADLVSCID